MRILYSSLLAICSPLLPQREAEAAAISIHDSIFCVDNISGVGFLDSTGKSVTINYSDNHLRDVPSFTFLSSLKPNTVDDRAPHAVHQFEFSLCLPHNSTFSFVNISFPIPSVVPDQSLVNILNATLSDRLDALLNQISATEMWDILSAQRDSLFTSAPSTTLRF